MTAVILMSLAAPLISSVKADSASWYTSVDGVLDSDYYSLYPYAAKSVDVGFSKYGELIGLPAGADPDTATQADWVGLAYDGRDPFCPATVVPMTSWINGWYMDIQYIDPALSGVKRDRHLFAFAMFGDGFGYGGDWVYAATPGGNPGHGRQTNGVCVTDDLEVLYDGPREYIAISRTHVYDKEGTSTWPVVDLTITIVFDKVNKQVILYKDVKLMLPKMHLWGKLDVQLSNREEYDLGPATGYSSYAHFYDAFDSTPYDEDWHMANVTLKEAEEYYSGNGSTKIFTVDAGSDIARDFMKVWIDGVFQDPATYSVNWDTGAITFNVAPADGAEIEVHYKYELKQDFGMYDVAQVVSSDYEYVAWTGMWPPVSDYTVDGILRYLDPLVNVEEVDCDSEPKQSPLIIGEWDFLMDHTDIPQFRCVEVKGISDRNDGSDSNHIVDTEALYQLDMVFNPWDLNDAVHKDTRRWLEWKQAGAGTSLTTKHTPVVVVSDSQWDDYCNFADRVIDYTTGTLLDRSDYDVSYNSATGTATFSGLTASHKYKILYSTRAEYEKLDIDPIVLFANDTSVDAETPTASFYDGDYVEFTDPLGMQWAIGLDDLSFTATALNTTDNFNVTFSRELNGWETNFEVPSIGNPAGNTYSGSWDFQNLTTLTDGANASVAISMADIHWYVTNPTLQNLKVWELGFTATLSIHLFYNATGDYMEITATLDMNDPYPYVSFEVMYSEGQMGRYEWAIVGRDAKTVDNAGSAMVAEAFDSIKEIQVGIAGTDLYGDEIATQIPYVMNKFSTATFAEATKEDYKDDLLRAALKDDWCTYWPVASSNMIGTGGPIANLFAYYANDFTTAVYGLNEFAGTAYANKITGISCWNRNWYGTGYNVYSSYTDSDIGYAVIATTKDINGTVIFNVWGHWGRDTYYAAMWLHGDEARGLAPGIIQLQSAPKGVTSIILEIDYTDPMHPTYTIPEVLGTISETLWYHSSTDVTDPYKGGIHDP